MLKAKGEMTSTAADDFMDLAFKGPESSLFRLALNQYTYFGPNP